MFTSFDVRRPGDQLVKVLSGEESRMEGNFKQSAILIPKLALKIHEFHGLMNDTC